MFRLLETLINFIIGIVEFFLGFRFIFLLFGANPAAPFVSWLYATTEPLLNPFRNMFRNGFSRGSVVAYSQLTNGAAGLAPNRRKIKRNPKKNSTIPMMKFIRVSSSLNICF